MREKLSNVELEERYQQGRLIARAFRAEALHRGKPSYNKLNEEIEYLYSKKNNEGIHKNVERHGQRGRSATLLVPGVDMTLFDTVGFLYDADLSTVKAYMFRDSQTLSQFDHGQYYNINIDRKKFEPIISRTEFIEKYRDYRNKVKHAELRDTSRDYENEGDLGYNEVLGNFFPESLIGLVGRDSTLETKRNLLLMKNVVSKQDLDLPMVLMDHGEIKVWNPSLQEIAEIINVSKDKITNDLQAEDDQNTILIEFANNIGFTLKNIDFDTSVTPDHLKINNKFEFKANEIIDYLSKITQVPKGSAFSYGIHGRLLEVVNKRLISENEEKTSDLKSVVLNKKDVENLISLLDDEMLTKNKDHRLITSAELKKCSEAIVNNINIIRSGENALNVEQLEGQKSSVIGQFISEFFIKVASFFKENVVTNSVEKFKSMKENLVLMKEANLQLKKTAQKEDITEKNNSQKTGPVM